jgi:hypothetical protein
MRVVKGKKKDTKDVVEQVNKLKIDEARQKFDAFQSVLNDKEYAIKLDKKETRFMYDNFLTTVKWKGYECYAVDQIYDALSKISNSKTGTINGKLSSQFIEAIFHFIKTYEGTGFENAKLFKVVADEFAKPMQELNNDRQILRDLSLELMAAENGISVEELANMPVPGNEAKLTEEVKPTVD